MWYGGMKHVRTHLPCLDTEWFSIIIVYNIGPKCIYLCINSEKIDLCKRFGLLMCEFFYF